MFEWLTQSLWRRILRQAIEPSLGLDAVMSALAMWEALFEDLTDLHKKVRQFCGEFATAQGIPSIRQDLAIKLIALLHQRSLNSALSLPSDPLGEEQNESYAPIPASAIKTTRTFSMEAAAAPVNKIDATLSVVIKHLCDAFESGGGAMRLKKLSATFMEEELLFALRLSSSQQNQWVVWTQSHGRGVMSLNFSEDQARTLVNWLYVFLTQAVGPVDADLMLGNAIHAAEKTEQGKRFSPRTLL
jgi:hypothetical protein